MKQKVFHAPILLKANSDETGEFTAVFATLEVIDHDSDVTRLGAFLDGQETLIEPWNHNYDEPPVGKGVIHEKDNQATIEGRFFLDTQSGLEHYRVVKNVGDIQEWSYTFQVEQASQGVFEEQEVQFLEKLDVWGVAPVTRGAGIDTRTTDIKGAKPYPNEHACRLRPPSDFQADSFRRITREHEGKKYSIIMGRLKDEDTMSEQAYRYPKEIWDVAIARSHCKDHDGSFEAASASSRVNPPEDQTVKGVSSEVIKTRIELIELED